MNKNFLIIVLLIVGFFFIIPLYAETTPVDMVILFDSSASVFPIYDDLLNFVINNIIYSLKTPL